MTEELRLIDARPSSRSLPQTTQSTQVTTSICGFCSTGCSLDIYHDHKHALTLAPNPNYPVNQGMACPKGWEALTPLDADDRGVSPLIKESNGRFHDISWQTALDTFRREFQRIQSEHGGDSLAWIGTGQFTVEEFALLGALGKFGLGFHHGDGNTRQCMATSVAAHKQSFGFDAPPYTYADFEASDTLVFIGANPCLAHPILWQRVLQNPNQPEIIVVDPRNTETAQAATQHVALKPKSDLYLLYGIAKVLIDNLWVDFDYIDERVNGFESFRSFLEDYPIHRVCDATGLTPDEITRVAEKIARGKAVSFWWTMGVNQGHQATRTAQAIINIALITGNIGRPGTGANSITGQCNAMGSRLFSNTTNLIGGHNFESPDDRHKIATILGIPEANIPQQTGLAYDQILDGVDSGRIKGLWIIATNTLHSWIHRPEAARRLAKLEFLVVQDMYPTTETAQAADLYLPAAGWGEKDGTFINSERRIGVIRKVKPSPGLAMSDFNIFLSVAEAWGCGELFDRWATPEQTFKLLTHVTKEQPCDMSGITDYSMIERFGGIQWPFPESMLKDFRESTNPDAWIRDHMERRLFEDGEYFTPDKRARLFFETPQAPLESPDKEFPFVLLTGRGTSAQWHTNTRTAKSPTLRTLYPERAYVEIHPFDAERLGIENDTLVEIQSRRGVVTAHARVVRTSQIGTLFMPMHYRETNELTLASFDPHSRQPSYKHCAVALHPASSHGAPHSR